VIKQDIFAETEQGFFAMKCFILPNGGCFYKRITSEQQQA